MLSDNRKAFTMMELIFVIVIISILSAVAIPKISAHRDDAKAVICAGEFGNIVTEISSNYTLLGLTDFTALTIGSMSNVKNGLGADTGTGIVEDGTALVSDGITYNCEADEAGALSFAAVSATGDYNLTITPDATATVPAAITTAALLKKNYKMEAADLSVDLSLSY